MKPIIFILALLISSSLHAQTINAEKRVRIKYLFSLMKHDSLLLKQLDASMALSKKMMTSMRDSTGIKADSTQQKRTDLFTQKMVSLSKENILKLVNEDMVEIYDQNFTSDEIEAFCAFYNSPAGKKMIRVLPAITNETAVRNATKYQPAMMKLVKEFMDESMKESRKLLNHE